MLITVAGPIGSGKTVLTAILAGALGAKALYEPVADNPIIDDFYRGNAIAARQRAAGDPDAHNPYAFLMQVYLLNRRFASMKKAGADGDAVLDRSIYEDRVFMRLNYERGNVTAIEWETYNALFENMMEELGDAPHRKSPDLMILLRVSYATMLRHIRKRGRPFEQTEADPSLGSYYRDLLRSYDRWAHEYDASPLLVVDGDRYDVEGDPADRAHVIDMVRRALQGARRPAD